MLGLMQDFPLTIGSMINHCQANHSRVPITSVTPEGEVWRGDFGTCISRAKQLVRVLEGLGVAPGDRIGTLAWNTHRHLECWYAISGMGAISHTINPRLFDEQITYILNHAEDKVLFFDIHFAPLVARLAREFTSSPILIALTDEAHLPKLDGLDIHSYEALLANQSDDYAWRIHMDENTAAGLCYTSGTTGNPKGVLYSHRSTVLHTLALGPKDTLSVSAQDTVLPVVPMFHANAWGVPWAATITGAKLVLNGAVFDGPGLHNILNSEQVTCTAAVPTVWLALLNHLEETGGVLPYLERVTIGGAAAPRSMIEIFETKYNVTVSQAWGMTEMSPLGTVGSHNYFSKDVSAAEALDLKCKQGRCVYGVEMKIVDETGQELPRDGKAFGHLLVRGPWTAREYYRGEGGSILDGDGWFDTGDVATIDPNGFMQITDRSKDVIKSGGEWISSIELENEAVGHPDVAEAAVIGVAHPKWDERPLLIVVKQPGAALQKADLIDHLRGRVAKWWLPDDVVFVESIPHTATGKIQKRDLRAQFADYKLPDVSVS